MTGYATGNPVLWPARPNWSMPVTETLTWVTDVMQAATGGQQARALVQAPRRGFAWQALADAGERRVIDGIAADIGVAPFLLPIYPDMQQLAADLAADSTVVPCETAGFDLAAGGRVALWSAINQWEVATLESVSGDHVTLTAGTAATWAAGTRLYPLRTARLQDMPQASMRSADVATLELQALLDEPCDWTAALPTATTYRGQPVLEWRNEESVDPTVRYPRLSTTLDQGTGPIWYQDLPGMPFRAQSQRFQLFGRDEHSAFRSLAYALMGRAVQLWVPSWLADVRPTTAITSSGTVLTVPWMGYTQFGRRQINRRDLAIELYDGSRYYRRITDSAESGGTETLTLDSALGVAVDPGAIRQIGFLGLAAAAADTVSITHLTDASGVATADIAWQGVASDV